ncbi:SRPBCC family protein [Streptomyces tendae]|uniref:SRPBCC family protein n=1 Tax=Streptomyces tendae TaxID=1932 RepID=UPI00342888A4
MLPLRHHPPRTHRRTARVRRPLRGAALRGHEAEFGSGVKGFTVDGSEGFDGLPDVSQDQDRRHYAVTVRPTVFVNLVPDHVILHRMFPLAEDRTVVECDWLYARGRGGRGGPVEAGGAVPPGQRPGLRGRRADAAGHGVPGLPGRRVLVPTEHHIGNFHAWLLDRLGEAPA